MIKINELVKDYNENRAVDHLSFDVSKGEFFAFLGPNGAGKSTTINVCTTLLKPTQGDITINGFALGKEDRKIRESIGVVFQYSFLDDLLTVKENMQIRASFYGLSHADFKMKYEELSRLIELDDIAYKKYKACSGGQRRRADIARALINSPKLLFLDEPTTGLDPQTRKKVWDVIKTLNRELNTTIFLTTHYMEEAEKADRVAIIDYGKLVACDTPTQLKTKHTYSIVKIKALDNEFMKQRLMRHGYAFKQRQDLLLVVSNSTDESFAILELVRPDVASFEVVSGTMDDVFLQITGREIREG